MNVRCAAAESGSGDTPIVWVVDHDGAARNAFEAMIRSAGWTARTFSSALGLLSVPRVRTPGCLVLDVKLPDLCGLELQQRVADRSEMPVIFVTRHSDVLTTVRAMKAGALEFLMKPLQKELLLSAIGSAIEHSRVALTREADLRVLRDRYASLSCREREVMALVVRGRLNKLIGAELGISEITVKAHRGKMMRKMRAHCVPELVTIAARLSSTPASTNDNRMADTSAPFREHDSNVSIDTIVQSPRPARTSTFLHHELEER